MTAAKMSFRVRIFIAILILAPCILLTYNMNIYLASIKLLTRNQLICVSDPIPPKKRSNANGWQPIGHTYEEQVRLFNIATMVAIQSNTITNDVPTVPCLSADGHLLVVSAGASRVRYGTSLSFNMIYPTDVKTVLPKNVSSNPLSSHNLNLWCIFDDGSVTPAYSYDSNYGNDRVSLLDCALSPFARDQLWRLNLTLRVYLASTTDKNRNTPILKAFINVPKPVANSINSGHEQLTLCTSPLHNKAKHLIQWIEFHRLVGFRKFVIYNTTDTSNLLSSVLSVYTKKYPNLVDVVQWNFSSLALVTVMGDRYFQIEALHDCLVRYGDQSEWLGMFDLDEYIVPLYPYETVLQYLHDNFGRRIVGSVNLFSQFFCTKKIDNYTVEEADTSRLVIERFVLRAPQLHIGGREKYLYRPRFVQYLSIHHTVVALSKEQPNADQITLAHYASMDYLRVMPGCNPDQYVTDTRVRDRFASRIKNATGTLSNKI